MGLVVRKPTFALVQRDLDTGYSSSAAGIGIPLCCVERPRGGQIESFLVLGVYGGGIDVQIVDGVTFIAPP
jgi:hypothetical protein